MKELAAVTVTATPQPANATGVKFVWTTDNASVATVTTSGVITGRTAGSATITITSNGISKDIQVTVIEYVSQIIAPSILPVALNAEPRPVDVKFLPEGKTTQLNYSFVPEGIASIDDAGRLVAVSTGNTSLTISDMDNDAVSVTVPVTVFPSDYVPLLLSGSVSPVPLLMQEQVAGKKYHWEGNLQTGSFKFLYHPSYDLPSLNKGFTGANLTERTDAAQPDELFTISGGFYRIDVDRENMTISLATPQYTFATLYLVGDAIVGVGWNPGAFPANYNNGLYVWYCTLQISGESAIKIHKDGTWSNGAFRPLQHGQSIHNPDALYREGGDDDKWVVQPGDEGNYKVTLDVIDMKLYFERQ
jgi:hypothetical protein